MRWNRWPEEAEDWAAAGWAATAAPCPGGWVVAGWATVGWVAVGGVHREAEADSVAAWAAKVAVVRTHRW